MRARRASLALEWSADPCDTRTCEIVMPFCVHRSIWRLDGWLISASDDRRKGRIDEIENHAPRSAIERELGELAASTLDVRPGGSMNRHVRAAKVDLAPAPAPRDDLDAAFARFLRLDVANGDASLDTIRGYRSQLAAWVSWCADHDVDARLATVEDIKRYREDLVAQGRQPSTIAHKLNVLRRVYAAAVAAGLRADNPATGVRAPRDRRAPEDFGFLSEVELALLFRAVPHDEQLKHLRDRACSACSACRRCAPSRSRAPTSTTCSAMATVGRCWCTASPRPPGLPRPDVAEAVRAYLAARGTLPLGLPRLMESLVRRRG